ncbi:DNA replication/repair protein RecF [Peptoniphilus stercorisuis]|uniref:DNA replication and repair protein RecF n=1 Tax=Peptoniphilus stercorisuis TaxID=1436965 RepID=A0ABS4KCR6_9FIRM|nr:DNA replication/repair protein RecF [Peptoniphilus stercorisuis]MBP2025555.1 DNA replication and repair protein RecF [Peptoniphilus stercorisuis]
MKLLNLKLFNYRNYSYLEFFPCDKINVIVGKNAIGKTNLLEAVYILTVGKSFRTSRDQEIINLNKNSSELLGSINNFGYEDDLKVVLNRDEKNRYFLNSEELNLKNYKRDMASVIFSPSDLNMIKFSPQERRKYLDNLISKIDPIYEHNLSKYRKIVYERNKLLKKSRDRSLIDIYNFQLADTGVKILRTRLNIIKILEKYSKMHFKNLSGGENLKITYLSTIPLSSDESEMQKIFLKHLDNAVERDLELKYTTIGPHRDDLDFKIEDLSVKSYGSQGEIRSVVLSLKLAEVNLIRGILKSDPILLLDDVFSELDKNRAKYLINSLNNVQTFITSTDLNEENFKDLEGSFFEIENSKITKRYNRLGD